MVQFNMVLLDLVWTSSWFVFIYVLISCGNQLAGVCVMDIMRSLPLGTINEISAPFFFFKKKKKKKKALLSPYLGAFPC